MRDKTIKISGGKRQYIITLVCTLLAITLIVGLTFGSFYINAANDAIAIGEGAVAQQSEKLNNFLLKGLDVVEVTKINVEYMMENGADSEEILKFLLHQSENYTNNMDASFTGIYGLFNGEYLDGIGWIPDEDYDPRSRTWYTAAMEGKGEPVLVSPYVDAQTNSVMMSVSQMLSDGESVISLDIVMDEMQAFAESINLNGNGYGFIINANGLVVAHSDEKEKGKNYLTDEDMQDTEMQQTAKRIIKDGEKNIHTTINGADSRIFSKEVQDRWYVVMVINGHDLMNKVERNLIIDIALSMVIFGLVAYFCTANYKNRTVAIQYANELEDYQATLEERVREQTEEIRVQAVKMIELQKNALEGMATLIESRDGNTGTHVRSTKKYVSMIVRYMYLNKMHKDEITKEYVENVIDASILHDVGKIKISDVILNKSDRFTEEEFEIMKSHAAIGGEIVKDILGKNADEELVQIASDIARYHHEKWDGSGYPEGLKGEEIPLSARIMAVADVFDALISKRIYKDSMSIDKVFQILQENAGGHFDPEIVAVFMKLRLHVEAYLDIINRR